MARDARPAESLDKNGQLRILCGGLPREDDAMSDANANNRAVWFDIPVADLDRAVRFYQAVLAVRIAKESFRDLSLGVIEHEHGNGGCLVLSKEEIAAGGVLLYLNANGRIRDAVSKVVPN